MGLRQLLSVALLTLVSGDVTEFQPLHMDVEWVLQGKSLGFSGFFCEFLGLSSGLREIFPQLRFAKSRARLALMEPLVGFSESSVEEANSMTADFFAKQLLEKEGKDSLWLSYHTQNASLNMSNSPKSKFFPEYVPKVEESCLSTTVVHEGVAFGGGELARAFVPLARAGPEECCKACQENPLCTSWTYAPYNMGALGQVIGEAGEHEFKCIQRGGAHVHTSGRPGAVSGEMIHIEAPMSASVGAEGVVGVPATGARQRMMAPRAIVFHGTMCVHNNETVYQKELKRDINTIRIGRFMIERKDLRGGGMTQDEFSVMSCFSHMDRVWVPTAWHKDAFLQMFTRVFGGSGVASSVQIDVIPEAVDVEVFDPTLVRKPEAGNPFRLRSRKPADLCTITPPSSPAAADGQVECATAASSFEFLSVFKWEYRKGWDILLSAYWHTFSKHDSVVLRLRTYMPPWEHEQDTNITKHVEAFARQTMGVSSLSELAPVTWETGKNSTLLSDSLSRADIRDMLASADCFVLPTRGEGWGLPIAEAMAMRIPTIVSDCPGPRAYATDENAYLIPPEENDPELVDARGYFKPDREALGSLMRKVIWDSGPQGGGKALAKTAKARSDMAALSPIKIAAMMAASLREEAGVRGWLF